MDLSHLWARSFRRVELDGAPDCSHLFHCLWLFWGHTDIGSNPVLSITSSVAWASRTLLGLSFPSVKWFHFPPAGHPPTSLTSLPCPLACGLLEGRLLARYILSNAWNNACHIVGAQEIVDGCLTLSTGCPLKWITSPLLSPAPHFLYSQWQHMTSIISWWLLSRSFTHSQTCVRLSCQPLRFPRGINCWLLRASSSRWDKLVIVSPGLLGPIPCWICRPHTFIWLLSA